MIDNPENGTDQASYDYDDMDEEDLVHELAQAEMESDPVEPQDDDGQDNDDQEAEQSQEAEEVSAEDDADEEYNWQEAIADQTFTVKVNGAEMPVTGSELLNGYQRQSDYSRGKADLAQQRAALDNQVRTQVLADYGERLEWSEQLLTVQLGQEPDPQLAAEDPALYAEAVQAYKHNQQILAYVQDQKAEVTKQRQEQAQRNMQMQRAAMAQDLLAWKPELDTPEGFQSYQAKINQHASHYGYSPNETSIVNATDSRMLKVFDDAIKWREHSANITQQKTEQTKADKAKRPPVVKGSSNNPAKSGQKQFKQRLSKASEDDLVKMLADAGG